MSKKRSKTVKRAQNSIHKSFLVHLSAVTIDNMAPKEMQPVMELCHWVAETNAAEALKHTFERGHGIRKRCSCVKMDQKTTFLTEMG